MELKIFRKIFTLTFLLFSVFLIFSCRDPGQKGKVIEAYKNLYEAVKSQNIEKIKGNMSKSTVSFAEFASKQNKKPIEEVFKNGFTATTFAETLPEIRDERIKDNYGAVEVWNTTDKKWEDLPFILEDGAWKLAVGEAFRGNFKSPGKGLAAKEQEAANPMSDNKTPVEPAPANMNVKPEVNININAIKPKVINPMQKNANANK